MSTTERASLSIAPGYAAPTEKQAHRTAILIAKTHYREAYNTSDPDRLLSVFASSFIDCSDGEPSFYAEEAVRALQLRTRELFRRFEVEMAVIVADINITEEFAYDWGWHKVKLIDRYTRDTTFTKYRYFETWKKEGDRWKISHLMTNKEQPPRLLPEEKAHSPCTLLACTGARLAADFPRQGQSQALPESAGQGKYMTIADQANDISSPIKHGSAVLADPEMRLHPLA
jgi:ketosteroid isomerase-like protein